MLVSMVGESSERRTKLIEVALKLFRENGFHGTSMRDIAAGLKVEATSLYNHIASKEEILHQTCFGLGYQMLHAMDEVNDLYFNAKEKLSWAVLNHIELLTNDLDAGYVFVHEWRNLTEPSKSEFIELRKQYEKQFLQIIENGETEGMFNETDKKFAVLTILASLNWVVEWYKPIGNKTPKQIGEKLTKFILTGLQKDI